MISRGLLILAFLVLTAPISAHAIGRAAWLAREPMEQPDNLDESGRLEPLTPGKPCDRPADL